MGRRGARGGCMWWRGEAERAVDVLWRVHVVSLLRICRLFQRHVAPLPTPAAAAHRRWSSPAPRCRSRRSSARSPSRGPRGSTCLRARAAVPRVNDVRVCSWLREREADKLGHSSVWSGAPPRKRPSHLHVPPLAVPGGGRVPGRGVGSPATPKGVTSNTTERSGYGLADTAIPKAAAGCHELPRPPPGKGRTRYHH